MAVDHPIDSLEQGVMTISALKCKNLSSNYVILKNIRSALPHLVYVLDCFTIYSSSSVASFYWMFAEGLHFKETV